MTENGIKFIDDEDSHDNFSKQGKEGSYRCLIGAFSFESELNLLAENVQ